MLWPFIWVLKHSHNPKRNITKEEVQALAELKKDQSRVILTADKGVTLVVMDRVEYNSKAQELLKDGGTYKRVKSDPTVLFLFWIVAYPLTP